MALLPLALRLYPILNTACRRRQTVIANAPDRAQLEASTEEKRAAFRDGLLKWAKSHLRDYPWRHGETTPYGVLVAELLLKRTSAAAAARLYEAFLRKYPTLVHLATTPETELAKSLAPVGLYTQRAKAIRALASYVSQVEGGEIPQGFERLRKVPGLGDYSARAVLSFGYDMPIAIVDANVARVLCRVFQTAMPARPTLWLLQSVADVLLPEDGHRDFNFALLDLGSLVCRYAHPRHGDCPLKGLCDLYKQEGSKGPQPPPVTRLKELRTRKRMGLVELAKRAGISKLTLINVEAGRVMPRPKTIERVADALGVSVEDLTGQGADRSGPE